MAISMQQRQALDIAQASTTFTQSQAMQLVMSAEEIAKAGLSFDLNRDINQSEEWDTASELWNQAFPTQIDNAFVEVRIRDLQGLFNLNWLHPAASNPSLALARFKRLITIVDPLFSDASAVANNLRDWFTPSSSANYIYENNTPPYRAGEIVMTHPSELKLVEGVTNELFYALEPHITALPSSIQLNINTTTAKVLSAWDSALSETDAEALVKKTRSGSCGKDRGVALYKTVSDFMSDPIIEAITSKATSTVPATIVAADFAVNSTYFSILSRVTLDIDGDTINDADINTESILRRKPNSTGNNDGFTGIIYRDLSRKPEDHNHLKIVDCT
ncbi:hypothetical protein NBRC116188_01610 [Oceaniserpentilla sp. 4NH20-0058]